MTDIIEKPQTTAPVIIENENPVSDFMVINNQKADSFQSIAEQYRYARAATGCKGIAFPRAAGLDRVDANFYTLAKIENGNVKELLFSTTGNDTVKEYGSNKSNFEKAAEHTRLLNRSIASTFQAGQFNKLTDIANRRDDSLTRCASALHEARHVSENNIRVYAERVKAAEIFLQRLESLKIEVAAMLKTESAISTKFETDRLKELDKMESEFLKLENETANVMVFDGITDEMIEGAIPDFSDGDDESEDSAPEKRK